MPPPSLTPTEAHLLRAGYNLKPRCQGCGHMFLHGYKKVCKHCQNSPGQGQRARHRPVRCDCGQPAQAIVEIRVDLCDPADPEHLLTLEYLRLCAACAILETCDIGPGLTVDYRPR